MSGGFGLAQPAQRRPLDGNAKGLPTILRRRRSAKIGGVSHQSVAWKGEVHDGGYPRRRCSRRGRFGQAGDPGPCGRQGQSIDHRQGIAPRPVPALVREAAPRLPGCHGGQLQRTPLVPAAVGHWAGRAHRVGATGRAVPPGRPSRQERRQRCRSDLRGRGAPAHALRAGEVGGAACCVCTSCAKA